MGGAKEERNGNREPDGWYNIPLCAGEDLGKVSILMQKADWRMVPQDSWDQIAEQTGLDAVVGELGEGRRICCRAVSWVSTGESSGRHT